MSYEGLDPVAVGAAAAGLKAKAAQLEQTLAIAGRLVDQASHHWEGKQSQDFASKWRNTLRPSGSAAVAGLADHAALLRRQIDEQVHASGGSSGSTLSAVGGGGGGGGGGWAGEPDKDWLSVTDPELKVGGKHTFIEGQHTEYHPAPGFTETADAGRVDGEASVSLDKEGLVAAAGITATAVAVSSKGQGALPGAAGTYELGASSSVDAKAGASARLGPSGASVGAQAMVGWSGGVEGGVGNDKARVTGKVEAVAGVGVEASANAKIEKGKLKIGYKAGAALLFGAKVGGSIDIDINGAKRAAEGAARQIDRWKKGKFW